MKSSTRYGLTSAAALFALCASVVACGPGGGGYRSNSYPTNPSYPSYPPQYSTANSTPFSNATRNVNSSTASLAPQARLTVLSSDAPTANVQLASPASAGSGKATLHEVSVKETTPDQAKTDSAVSKALDATASVTTEGSKIADAIKGLVGTWMAVARQGEGELSTVELQLDDSGWAKLTVPGADGTPSTTTRKVEFENSELKLIGSGADVSLGKLVNFDSRQMVLERSGGQVTFVRP